MVVFFSQFYNTEYVNKMTMTSTFHHRFQHIIRQIVCFFISFPYIYNIIIFKAKWDRQIKVYVYFFFQKISSVIFFSKTVLKVKICEKYKICGMLLISWIKIFTKYFNFMNKCSMNEYDSVKMYSKHQSQITKKEQFQNY